MDVPLRTLGRVLALVVSSFCLSCGKEPRDKPSPLPSTEEIEQAYLAASQRLVDSFLEGGWVVTRKPDGSPEHMGEGLLWSGIAMAALPCAMGDPIEATLIDMVKRQGGALVRYEPLGEYAGGREVTLDGALGFYRGVAERIVRCGKGNLWAPVLGDHLAFLNAHGWRLHPNVSETLVAHFDYLVELLGSQLGVYDRPADKHLRDLENEVSVWAAGVNATHAACYRIHLGYIAMQTAVTLGREVSSNGRSIFCAATRGTDIPIVDQWCGRGDLVQWINNFEFNRYEFQFQRCPPWEAPDGDGDSTPGLDLLVAYRQAYQLKP